MKGLICGIKRMAVHDGDGLRTTVFFKGCPLKCVWCHNPESINFQKEVGVYKEKCIACGSCKNGTAEENVCPVSARVTYGTEWEALNLAEFILQDREFFENSKGGVTLSGGECLAQPEFAIELASILHKTGVRVNIDTCGYVSKKYIERIIPYTDVFLYDVKSIDNEKHIKFTGKDNKIILDNLQYLSDRKCEIEVRYPYVKGYNDDECEKIGMFLNNLKNVKKIKVLGYHGFADAKYAALEMENTLPRVFVTEKDVQKAVDTLKKYGLQATYSI